MTKYFKVSFIGDSGVGKTSIIRAILGQEVKKVTTTIGIDVKTIKTEVGMLMLWDFAGQEWFREVIAQMIQGSHVIVMVFDLSRPETLEDLIKDWSTHITKYAPPGVIKIVAGNKKDIKMIPDDVLMRYLDELKSKVNYHLYIDVSALTKESINSLFKSIVEMAKLSENLAVATGVGL